MTTDRTKGIGGTDIGAIIGANPWKGPMDVYLEKTGITEPQEDNEAMWLGREMEPVLAKRYEKETKQLLYFQKNLPLRHPGYEWYLGSPDAQILSPPVNAGVDFKTTGRRNDYGDPGTDQVPEWIHTQADWYMGLTEAQWWDIAVLFFSPRREFQIYRIPRNQELINNLIAAGREFWENHVVPRIPPPLDASNASKTLLNHLYPRNVEDLFAANEDIEEIARWIKVYEEERDETVAKLVLMQNEMKEKIGNHAGVVTSLGKVTWRKNKDSQEVDWKAAFDLLSKDFLIMGTQLDMPFLNEKERKIAIERAIRNNTTIRPGARVFRTWFKED